MEEDTVPESWLCESARLVRELKHPLEDGMGPEKAFAVLKPGKLEKAGCRVKLGLVLRACS